MDIKVIASGSSGNSTMICDGSSALLLDAGVSIKDLERGSGWTLSLAPACLVTHEHLDHSKACKDLAKRGIDVYASEGTLKAIKVEGHRAKAVCPLKRFVISTFTVLGFDVKHDAAEPMGYLIHSNITGEQVLYVVDTAYIRYTPQGLTHIIIECNHGNKELRESVDNGTISADLAKRIAKNHFSLERLIEFLKSIDLSATEEIHLVHLSDNNSDENRFRREVQQLTGIPVYVH